MSFSADIRRFIDKTRLSADLVLRKLAFDAYAGVVKRSPVDTGRFRSNWRVGINRVDASTTDQVTGEATQVGRAFEEISKATHRDTIHISNNLPYAVRLENGWSDQAPEGVLALTFEELKANVAKAVAEVNG